MRVDAALAGYVLDVVEATRNHPEIALGASTRAALSLYRAAQAFALIDGRGYVVPDDVKRLASPVLAHRLLSPRLRQGGRDDLAATALIDEILARTPVPG